MDKPLAYRLRPQSFDDVIGQEHLVGKQGVLRKMVNKKHFSSIILYGPPGVGKTTIAMILGEAYGLRTYTFNASTDVKASLKEMIHEAMNYGALLIVDEIHRMKKDIQDYLLPHVEKGTIKLVGLTTNNPYHSVNPAIRSRTHVYKLNDITPTIIKDYLVRLHGRLNKTLHIDDDVFTYISFHTENDIRSAINRYELLINLNEDSSITLDNAKRLLQKPTLNLDKDEDNYYNILSAFQKSVRGSDVNASLHYLARLLVMEDLESILRRLTVIAYEDIGLANPTVFSKMHAATHAVHQVGMPEARIILSALVIDLALSPKSNSALISIDQAIRDVEQGLTPKIPNHLINVSNFESKTTYKYPHDYLDQWVKQDYLPDSLLDKEYFKVTKASNYDKALSERYEKLKKMR